MAVTAVRLTKPASDRQTVMDALRFAVEMQRKGAATAPDAAYMPGVAGYDWWIAALQREDTNSHGASSNAQFWAECRRMAVEFLKEAKERLSDPDLAPLFDEAIGHYTTVAGKLSSIAELFPMDGQWAARLKDKALCGRAIAALKEARAAEAKGLRVLARIVGEELDPSHLAERTPVAPAQPADKPAPRRAVLDGVPPARYGQPGYFPFGVCMASLLTYLGEEWTWQDIVGYSGAGFRMGWNYKEWDEGNMDLGILCSPPMRRGIQAFGYRPRFMVLASWWSEEKPGEDIELLPDDEAEARFREAIVRSIQAGMPVLALGVIGPPEVSIITGYDEGGDVLIGWSCFQDGHPKDQLEPSGAFRQRDWFPKTKGLILIEGKLPEAEAQHVRDGAVEWAYRMGTYPTTAAHLHGLAAYKGWADGMRDDEAFPASNKAVLQSRRYTIWDGLIMLADREAAAGFLEEQAERRTDVAEHLRNAAAAFREDGRCGEKINTAFGGPSLPSDDLLADPKARSEAADQILKARELHAKALGHLRDALAASGVQMDGLPPSAPGAPVVAGGKHMLEGLAWKQRFVAHMGCMKGCLEFLGSDVSWPWLYGCTGHAFALNIAGPLDPSGPTAWHWEMIHELGPNLGFRVRAVWSPEWDPADVRAARQREAWDFVRDAVNRGLPCYGWGLNLWIPDHYVITGYDDVGYYWSGWGESKDPLPWQKLGTGDVSMLHVFRLELCKPASDAAAVKAALAEVLAHVEDPGGWTVAPGCISGVAAYDAWAQALEAGTAERDGNAYNAATWHECREMAVEFLKEAKGRLPGRCDPAFDEAIAHYTVVRDRLKALSDTCPMPKEGWDSQTRTKSAEAAALVRGAGAAERRGVEALKRIAAALDAAA